MIFKALNQNLFNLEWAYKNIKHNNILANTKHNCNAHKMPTQKKYRNGTCMQWKFHVEKLSKKITKFDKMQKRVNNLGCLLHIYIALVLFKFSSMSVL
jgi:hypothetical protein